MSSIQAIGTIVAPREAMTFVQMDVPPPGGPSKPSKPTPKDRARDTHELLQTVSADLLAMPSTMKDEHPYGVYGRLKDTSAQLDKAIAGYRVLVDDKYLVTSLVDAGKAIDELGLRFGEHTGEAPYPTAKQVTASLATPLANIRDADAVLRARYDLKLPG